jgi:hypothetical protein
VKPEALPDSSLLHVVEGERRSLSRATNIDARALPAKIRPFVADC